MRQNLLVALRVAALLVLLTAAGANAGYVDIDQLGLLDLDQIESALTPGSPPDEMTPLPAPEQQG